MASSCHRIRYTLWLLARLLVFCCLPIGSTAHADETILQVVTNLGGTLTGLSRNGDTALLTEGAGVTLLNLHDPTAPVRQISLPLPAQSQGVAMDGSRATVAMGQAGLQIVDLSNPSSPQLRGRYIPPATSMRNMDVAQVTAVALDGSLAYVLVGTGATNHITGGELQIIDVGNLDRPALLGTVNTSGWPVAVQVHNHVAYVASHSTAQITGGLEIFDVTSPSALVRLGFAADQTYGGYGIEVVGGFAYVGRVGVFDVRDPATPKKMAPLTTDILRVRGSYAYGIATGDNHVAVFDLTDSAMPQQVATVTFPAPNNVLLNPIDLVITANQLVLVSDRGLYLFSLGDPVNPTVIGQFPGGNIDNVFRINANVYANANIHQTWQLHSNGTTFIPAPALSGQFLGADSKWAFLIKPPSWGTLLAVDLANPEAPPVGTLSLPGDPEATGQRPITDVSASALEDGLLYLGVRHTGSRLATLDELVIINVHDPRVPQMVGRMTVTDEIKAIAIVANQMYMVSNSNTVIIVDVRDPTNPKAAGQLNGGPQISQSIVAAGGWLYVAGEQALAVVDAHDPATIAVRTTVDLHNNGRHIALDGSRIVVGDESSLILLNADNPAQPILVGRAPLPAWATSVAVVGDRALVAMGDSGLRILRLGVGASQPITPSVDSRCFVETGQCISGPIRAYWERNGGLPVFGYPISAQESQIIEGHAVTAQWFERNRLELHPENAAPYDVLIGRVGADRLAQTGRDWHTAPSGTPTPGCRFFPETGHSVCGAFLARWRASGLELDGRPGLSEAENLALFGLPLTEPQPEQLSDGHSYTVQWFERARVELHPELGSQVVLLGLLGNELRTETQ